MIGLHQAHRGAGFLEDENTIEAVELGWSFGLAPEVDVSTTRDGVVVAFHDSTLDGRVRALPAHLAGREIAALDWAEIAHLDVGREGRRRAIPLMTEVFDRLRRRPEARLYLDIKRVDFRSLARLVDEHEVAGQVVFSTNEDGWIVAWSHLKPGGQTLRWVWADPGLQGLHRIERELTGMRRAGFPGITQVQLHVLVEADAFHPDPPFIAALEQELRARGILLQCFPHSGDPQVYRRLRDLGVLSFATDHPRELVAALGG